LEKIRCFRIRRLLGFLPIERLSLSLVQTQSRAKIARAKFAFMDILLKRKPCRAKRLPRMAGLLRAEISKNGFIAWINPAVTALGDFPALKLRLTRWANARAAPRFLALFPRFPQDFCEFFFAQTTAKLLSQKDSPLSRLGAFCNLLSFSRFTSLKMPNPLISPNISS
jgi:hypothetical protein